MRISHHRDPAGGNDWPASGTVGMENGTCVVFRIIGSDPNLAIHLAIMPGANEHENCGVTLDASVSRNPGQQDWMCPLTNLAAITKDTKLQLTGWQMIRVRAPSRGAGCRVAYQSRDVAVTYITIPPASIDETEVEIANGSSTKVKVNFNSEGDPCMHPADYAWKSWVDNPYWIKAKMSEYTSKDLTFEVERIGQGATKVCFIGTPHCGGEDIYSIITVK